MNNYLARRLLIFLIPVFFFLTLWGVMSVIGGDLSLGGDSGSGAESSGTESSYHHDGRECGDK